MHPLTPWRSWRFLHIFHSQKKFQNSGFHVRSSAFRYTRIYGSVTVQNPVSTNLPPHLYHKSDRSLPPIFHFPRILISPARYLKIGFRLLDGKEPGASADPVHGQPRSSGSLKISCVPAYCKPAAALQKLFHPQPRCPQMKFLSRLLLYNGFRMSLPWAL